MSGQRIGYIRVSTLDQHTERQQAIMSSGGCMEEGRSVLIG